MYIVQESRFPGGVPADLKVTEIFVVVEERVEAITRISRIRIAVCEPSDHVHIFIQVTAQAQAQAFVGNGHGSGPG